jgi:nitrite reductase/ring-hydroxylating ferredoxin subunit/uncharacterized membrane protein
MSSEVIPGEQKSWTETPPANPPLRRALTEAVENQTWLDTLADPIQSWLTTFFGQPGDPNRSLKNVLNGTWFGHPLHPAITDVPLGSWSATLLLDLAWLANEDEGIARGADLTLVLGLLGATGAAITGTADWSDAYGTDRRVGLMHGLLNVSIAATNTASWFLRLIGRRRAGIALSTTAYLTSLFTAYLGGELSFAKGFGVNHDAWEGGSDDFVAVMGEQDLPENKLTRVNAGGIPAVLLKRGNKIYAIGAVCTHQAGPLDEGTIVAGENGLVVQCPWHGSQFSMSDGRVVCGPAVYAQPTFAVRVRNGQIELRRLDHA